ncbi:hypothetical protein WAF17_16735 [Bernardetia sp. ABR2-2B]|uniref:hypothetical protein n=1 Tax=Bernardetia sp. ABR2-2B TaxID=3127472 RepID=UPI0030CE0C6E
MMKYIFSILVLCLFLFSCLSPEQKAEVEAYKAEQEAKRIEEENKSKKKPIPKIENFEIVYEQMTWSSEKSVSVLNQFISIDSSFRCQNQSLMRFLDLSLYNAENKKKTGTYHKIDNYDIRVYFSEKDSRKNIDNWIARIIKFEDEEPKYYLETCEDSSKAEKEKDKLNFDADGNGTTEF